jgi:hypothetical protein
VAEEVYRVKIQAAVVYRCPMQTISIQRNLYVAFVLLVFIAGIFILHYGMTAMEWEDFYVFYGAAKSTLSGDSLYRTTGEHNLPFWYFPWTAWIFIPLTLWSEPTALLIYKFVFVLCAILVVNSLLTFHNPEFEFLDKLFILSVLASMSLQTMIVGQLEYILLGLIVMTMYAIDQKRFILAGVLIPFLWTKPHLLIVFTLIAFWLGGMRMFLATALSSVLMLLAETVRSPAWYFEMFHQLRNGQARIDGPIFTTFPNMLGFQENWVGTANLPLTLLLIVLAVLAVWRFRSLSAVPLLSLALTASLFCAPRAYAYDLPLLIPAMIWLTAKDFKATFWIWIVAGVLPPLFRYGSATYLIILGIFVMAVSKAHFDVKNDIGTP